MDPNLLLTLLQILISLISGAIGAAAWTRFFRKKETRLFKNIQRPIGIISTADTSLQHEATLLKRVGFFNVEAPSSDKRAVDVLDDKRLVIIGYSPNSKEFKDAFVAAMQRSIPVIVYSKPGRIDDPEDMEMLQGYSHHSICNTPLRLVSDVFALMSTYPEDK